jgi:hypothetical protein
MRKRLHGLQVLSEDWLSLEFVGSGCKGSLRLADNAFAVSATMGTTPSPRRNLHGLVAIHYWHLKIHQYQPEMSRIRVTRRLARIISTASLPLTASTDSDCRSVASFR